MSDEPCQNCTLQLHALCENPRPMADSNDFSCCCWTQGGKNSLDESVGGGLLSSLAGFIKDPPEKEFKDVLSTGRHRAAKAKPLVDGSVCEWAGLKFAGGGIKPIIGCQGNVLTKKRGQYARHHGPDKSVFQNGPANLHLICPTCHNRWHTLNDEYYGDGTAESRPEAGESWLPTISEGLQFFEHDPDTRATATELVNNELMWAERKTKKADDENE